MQFRSTQVFGLVSVMMLATACRDDITTAPRATPASAPRYTAVPASSSGPLVGAIFTTGAACTGTNVNIFAVKNQVYLDGGPSHPGAAGLPNGYYAVRVTDPSGSTLLGTTVGSADDAPVQVVNGEFASCYRLSAILVRGSNGQPGYDDTPNGGGEYKVWISNGSDFVVSKTDNFKVKSTECATDAEICPFGESGTLNVGKWYDANANGTWDAEELAINGWKVNIRDGMNLDRFTPVAMVVAPDEYTISEYDAVQSNWLHTTPASVNRTVANGFTATATFGNVCTGAGGGHTLGFWSNKNGQSLEDDDDFLALNALSLRNADGSGRDFAGSLSQKRSALNTFLLSANASNMANMLSAQLAAMTLNVRNGMVSGTAIVYAPNTPGASSLGFTTIDALMTAADAQLAAHPVTVSAGSDRTIQEAIKTALDRANNNLNFVQSSPCPFSFSLGS